MSLSLLIFVFGCVVFLWSLAAVAAAMLRG